jgi:hypothetical protein
MKEMVFSAAIAVLLFCSIALVESYALETNTDRPGMDYNNFDLASANPSLCEQACNADPNCRAFTYVKPGVQGSSARCWLKNGIPAANPSDCCVSGVKGSTGIACHSDLPNPQLSLAGTESYSASGGQYTRYLLAVVNRAAYPADLFGAAPDLPACGSNTNSARTWVDIYDQNDNRIYGFCTLDSPADLGNLWFAVAAGATPPNQVYIVINDRRCDITYRSNPITIPTSGGSPGGGYWNGTAPGGSGTAPGSIDLTGVWNCDDGGRYYIRQLGATVWWYGENTPDWSNVMRGTISGSTINADWTDVPKGSVMQNGMLTLQIQSNNRIVAISKTGGFAGSVWTR